MQLHLFNTLTRQIEPVEPLDGQCLRFYCCGPTVYGPAHIGNFRTFVIQDLFRRVVEGLGMQTRHVRNVTDVDDKTIRDSQAAGQTLADFTQHWLDRLNADCEHLNMLTPHVVPSAVAHIEEQIRMIQQLIDKDLAYQADNGSVYFRIRSFPDYGKLSGHRPEGMLQNADQRLNESDEYEKESVNDFALWKAWKAEDGQNRWESPWGWGRPGWHIECSAMSVKYLGPSIDLHSGGVDLIFPHHENEIAQSEGATEKPFTRHWFHIAHLRVEGQKMSKSLGNLYTLEDVLSWGHTGDELRYVLISGHYRQPLNFTRGSLQSARSAIKRVHKAFAQLPENELTASTGTPTNWGRWEPVVAALCDDLNVPKAFGALHTALGELEKAASPASDDARILGHLWKMFGFRLPEKTEAAPSEIPESVQTLAEQRQAARAARNWAEADRLRDALQAAGWKVQDRPNGYEIQPLG